MQIQGLYINKSMGCKNKMFDRGINRMGTANERFFLFSSTNASELK